MTEERIENSEFGNLIDGSLDDFLSHCKDKNLGYVMSLKNSIAGSYQTLLKVRESLIDKIKQEDLKENSEEMQTLKGVYLEIMRLEEKACACADIIKEKSHM